MNVAPNGQWQGRLPNRVAIITGAASGIGRAIAIRYAREGAVVVVADLETNSRAADEADTTTVDMITREHGENRALFVQCNVTDSSSVDALVAGTVEKFGRLDIFVNNAGCAPEADVPTPVFDTPDHVLHQTLDVNVKGVYYGVRAASRQMIAQQPLPEVNYGARGWIINMASVAGTVGALYAPAYVASKHAVVGLTKAAALDCADELVHVNAICPGFVHSNLLKGLLSSGPNVGPQLEQQHVFRGMGRPEDIAGVAVFLASDDARWMTGTSVEVDGGYTKH